LDLPLEQVISLAWNAAKTLYMQNSPFRHVSPIQTTFRGTLFMRTEYHFHNPWPSSRPASETFLSRPLDATQLQAPSIMSDPT
jgi:hypothetical protein